MKAKIRNSFLLIFAAACFAPILAQSGGQTVYVYDDIGRLTAVIAPNGEAAVYGYDPAGNFTGIRRLAANQQEILAFTPREGPFGTVVTIFGTGFGGGVSSVAFNGTNALIVGGNFASVIAIVPAGASTGPISVTTPLGTVSTSTPFTVRGVFIAPQAVTMSANETLQFNASVIGTNSMDLTWSVNGQIGGSQAFGTISASGFYTAPNLQNSPPLLFLVRATSDEDPSLFSESIVTVVSAGSGYQFRSNGVSVRYGAVSNSVPAFATGAVSVRYGAASNPLSAFSTGGVSVRYGAASNPLSAFSTGGVSVRSGAASNSLPVFLASGVSVGKVPVLSSLAPVSLSRGTAAKLTISGSSLQGATSVRFFRLDAPLAASGVTVTDIAVNGAGTSLTATAAVGSDIPVGRYLVMVTTPLGSTIRSATVGNTVEISP